MNELLSAFGIDWRLIFIQGLNFLILLGALSYFLYKPVLALIEKRTRDINEGIQKAIEAEETLALVETTKKETLFSAEKEASRIVQGAEKLGKEKHEQMMKETERRAQELMLHAEESAKEKEEALRRESEKEIARLAILMSERLLNEKQS